MSRVAQQTGPRRIAACVWRLWLYAHAGGGRRARPQPHQCCFVRSVPPSLFDLRVAPSCLIARRQPLPRRSHEGVEQRPELPGTPEVFRVPLHAHAESRLRRLDAFDDAIRRRGGRDETPAECADRLVMTAVDTASTGCIYGAAQRGMQARVADDVNVVRD